MKAEPMHAFLSNDSDHSDDTSSDDDSKNEELLVEGRHEKVLKREPRQPQGGYSSSSSEGEQGDVDDSVERSDGGKNNNNDTGGDDDYDDDDKWSDQDSAAEAEIDDDDESEDGETKQSLSLMERLANQEAKQQTLSTITALKDRRERRNRAIPIAKERLQAFRKKTATTTMNEKKRDRADDSDCDGDCEANEKVSSKRKKSKHAPTEVSSRRSRRKHLNESGIGVEIGKHRYEPRDPRLSSLSGHLDEQQFEHHYGFLSDLQTNEISTLKNKLKALQRTGKQGQRARRKLGITAHDTAASLQEQLSQLQNSVARQNQQRLERNSKRAVKQKLQAQVAEGKGGVYFPKRQEMKRMQMEAKIEEIKTQKGKQGLDKYLAKKRKKQKSRHAKKMRTVGGDFGGG